MDYVTRFGDLTEAQVLYRVLKVLKTESEIPMIEKAAQIAAIHGIPGAASIGPNVSLMVMSIYETLGNSNEFQKQESGGDEIKDAISAISTKTGMNLEWLAGFVGKKPTREEIFERVPKEQRRLLDRVLTACELHEDGALDNADDFLLNMAQ